MSEQEAIFLTSSLGLFRNVKDFGRATPRANTSLVRVYKAQDFYDGLKDDDDLLHLIAHADATTLQTGNGKSSVKATDVLARATTAGLTMPKVVVSTACNFHSPDWQAALKAAGVQVLIASRSEVTPANLTAFDMAFYSALLSRVRKTMSTAERVKESFALADQHYRAIHADGSPFAKFRLTEI